MDTILRNSSKCFLRVPSHLRNIRVAIGITTKGCSAAKVQWPPVRVLSTDSKGGTATFAGRRATAESTEEHRSKWADHYPQEILDLSWSNTSEEIVKKGYKIWADDYEKWVFGSKEGSTTSSPGYVAHMTCAEAFNEAVCELYGENKKNLKVLDLGCGTGLAGKVLKERFGFTNLVGLDVSEDMLKKARKREIYTKFIYAYVSNERVEEIKNAEFDAVVSSGVFTTGQVRPNAFDEIVRWIKPGGIICFTCPVFDNEEDGYKEKCSSLEENSKWKLISNTEADYYGDKVPYGLDYKTCRMLVYRILPF